MPALDADLRGAVGRGEISAWFQAQHDVLTGQIVAVEALCRWHHPELGPIDPSVFIALAEKSGDIQQIGQFMMEQSWAAAAELSHSDHRIEVSVNVSPVQLITSKFTDRLAHELDRLSLPPLSLTIEITESLPIADVPAVVQRLDELRRLGLGISLDDFGVGHTSLKQVRRLHATELKIDQTLVRDDSDRTTALLADVVRTVHEAGLRVVAEGVETPSQLDRVRALGCDRVQGYLLGVPMPKHEIVRMLSCV